MLGPLAVQIAQRAPSPAQPSVSALLNAGPHPNHLLFLPQRGGVGWGDSANAHGSDPPADASRGSPVPASPVLSPLLSPLLSPSSDELLLSDLDESLLHTPTPTDFRRPEKETGTNANAAGAPAASRARTGLGLGGALPAARGPNNPNKTSNHPSSYDPKSLNPNYVATPTLAEAKTR